METKIEEQQLDDELQELYIISKHWISDITFLQSELSFLKNVLHKYLDDPIDDTQLTKAESFSVILGNHDATITALTISVSKYLKYLEPLINDPKKKMSINMLERFAALGDQISTLSDSVKHLKAELFVFIEQAMQSGQFQLKRKAS